MKTSLNTYLIFCAISATALLSFSCGPKKLKREKELRILYSTDEFDTQYSREQYLNRSLQYHPEDFFTSYNDTVPLVKWDSLLEQLVRLKRYKPDLPDILHQHNYCSHVEIEFFDHEKSVCQLCLNPDDKTVRYNYLVYEASPELISFFRDYIAQDSTVFTASGKSDYVKKVMFSSKK